jgi:O-antigen ligase
MPTARPTPIAPKPVRPWTVLALTMFLVAALGVPGERVLQDTLKSALVVSGALVAGMVFLWQRRSGQTEFAWHGLIWLPLALAASALASTAWSHTYLATVELVRWSVFALLLWLGANTFTQANARHVIAGIHAGAVAAALWAGLQFWFDLRLFPQGASPASTFINRNFFAEYAVCALPFSVFVLLSARAGKWPWIHALAVASVIVAILMTGTRSALLALALQLPLLVGLALANRQQFAAGQWGVRRAAGVLLLVAVTVGALGALPTGSPAIRQDGMGSTPMERGLQRAASVTRASEYTSGSFSVRASLWKATWRMVAAQPWTGVGAGAWEVAIPLYQGPSSNRGLETDYYAHNEILQLLAEYGVVAGGLFVAILLAYGLQAGVRTWRLPGHQQHEAPLRWFALASLLSLLVVSNAGFPWRLAATGAIFALCLGLLAASDARLGTTDGLHASTRRLSAKTVRLLLIAGLCACGVALLVTVQAMCVESKLVGAIHRTRAPATGAPGTSAQDAARKAELLQLATEGIALNPHYRKLTTMIADALAANGDWANALWVWESVAASRPNIGALRFSIVLANMRLGRDSQALAALESLARLEPDSPRVRALNALLLARTGQTARAAELLQGFFARGEFDADLLQVGYAVGLETQNWPLAIRSLELRIQAIPALAVDAYVRLGAIYSDPRVRDDARALQAYRAAYALVPVGDQDQLKRRVPEKYRSRLE